MVEARVDEPAVSSESRGLDSEVSTASLSNCSGNGVWGAEDIEGAGEGEDVPVPAERDE